MTMLSFAARVIRGLRNRLQVQALDELDDRTLADIGLLRTDVRAALARPYFADPAKALKDACCHWSTLASGALRSAPDPVICC